MATRRPAHNMPIHMDFLSGFLKKGPKSMWIGVLRAGLRVAMWITHVGGKFRHGLLEKSLNQRNSRRLWWFRRRKASSENSAQRGSFWPDVPADIQPKTSVSTSKCWKKKHFGTDIPRGRPRKNFGLKNFRLIFRSLEKPVAFLKVRLPSLAHQETCCKPWVDTAQTFAKDLAQRTQPY